MNGVPYPRRPIGRGHNVYPDLEFWEDRPGRNPGTSLVKRDPVSGNFKLHVRSIPPSWNTTIFENVFSKCGDPQNIYISPQRLGRGGMTWGFVEFKTYQEACNAVQQLNNNVLLNIQVMFAREKEEEVDPLLQLLNADPEEDPIIQRPLETAASSITRTIKNDNITPRTELPLEDYIKPILDLETQKIIEEALFQKRLEMYKEGNCCTADCTICEAKCSLACSGCTSVYYCSETCQKRDWDSHSRNCKGASTRTVENTMTNSQGGGDHKQGRSEFTNGSGSFDSDNRNNRFGDRKNNRDGEKGFNRDRNQRTDQNSHDQQDRAQGKKSLFEERKMRMSTSNSNRQNENDNRIGIGYQNRFGPSNQRSQNDQETRSLFKRRGQAEENWGSETQDNDVKDSSASTPGIDFINKEKAFLQGIEIKKQDSSKSVDNKPQAVSHTAGAQLQQPGEVLKKIKEEKEDTNVPASALEAVSHSAGAHLQQPGEVLKKIKEEKGDADVPASAVKVKIIHPEGQGLYWVHSSNQEDENRAVLKKVKEYFITSRPQFSPVKEGICGILYEENWFRCQIIGLDPLNVRYIDFGYPEEVEANRLFQLSSELTALPPCAFLLKLAEGTHESFLAKVEDDTLNVNLIRKIDNYWLAQVVDDKITLSEVPKAATPEPVTTPTPTAEPVQNDQGAQGTTQPDVPLQQLSTTQQASSQPVHLPFPSLFNAGDFTAVTITYGVITDQGDTYYVGALGIVNALTEMCDYFKSVIDHCEVVETPRHGTKGLAQYLESWYRVKVVSLSPLEAHFIDYGNIEELKPKELRKCPETHKDIPNLVYKIKLARGTDQKYFNLPELSQIKVKPVSWLPDGTIVVEVEGEDYTKTSEPGCTSSASPTAPTPTGPLPDAPSVPIGSGEQASSEPSSLQMDQRPRCSPSTVDLLQENWKVSFVPNKIDYVKNSLLGQVYCVNIPTTCDFLADNEKFQNHLSSLQFDPNFSPSLGEVVGLQCPSGECERGIVLPEPSLIALSDQCGVIRSFQLFKLSETFSSVPSMAAVFTLLHEDPDLLSRLIAEEEIIFDVVKVNTDKSRTVVNVTTEISQKTLGGELRTWVYEPLETPSPLSSGDLVTISKVLDSNTLLVAPANDLEIQQAIQIDCRITCCDEFKSPPKEGDYVSFLDKESDGYFRCRIDKVDKDEFTVYSVDNASYHQAKLSDLSPLPSTLRNVPCRITQIELKGVDKVDQTELAQCYLCNIVEEDKFLKIEYDNFDKATLTVEGEEDTLNSKLKELLKPKIVPDSDGKLTILSLPELRVPLNQEFELVVSQTEPLYIQLVQHSLRYYTELHGILQNHCASDNAPYNPCEGELCLAQFDGDWYRCRCLKETNTGMSVLMLVDYGNMFNTQTSNIRRILPEMLTMPSIAMSCKIHDLPVNISHPLKAQIDKILEVNNKLSGTFVAEHDGCYEVVIECVKQAIQELQ